jgi:hypothetical protein
VFAVSGICPLATMSARPGTAGFTTESNRVLDVRAPWNRSARFLSGRGSLASSADDSVCAARAAAGVTRTDERAVASAWVLRCRHRRDACAIYRAQRGAAGKDHPDNRAVWTPAATSPAPGPPTNREPCPRRCWIGVPRPVPDLRHAYASWLLAGGADIQVVKEWISHAWMDSCRVGQRAPERPRCRCELHGVAEHRALRRAATVRHPPTAWAQVLSTIWSLGASTTAQETAIGHVSCGRSGSRKPAS